MVKKTIKYVDYNGVEREEDFLFNLSKAELIEMETDASSKGGFKTMVEGIIEAKDSAALVKIFKDIIFKAYGKKSIDGKRFEKSEEISREFAQTEAYTELFMELATDDKAAAEFVNGLIPKDIAQNVVERQENGK